MNKIISEPTVSVVIESCINESAAQALRPRLHSSELFGTAREIVIEHAGDEYRLRLTRQGKLILTK
jgi:hemin uptake protein HemP